MILGCDAIKRERLESCSRDSSAAKSQKAEPPQSLYRRIGQPCSGVDLASAPHFICNTPTKIAGPPSYYSFPFPQNNHRYRAPGPAGFDLTLTRR